MKVQNQTQSHRDLIEQRLKEIIPSVDAAHALLYKAARYSLLLPAKRFRPLLTLAVLEDFDVPLEYGINPACALEMVHTYSLIHDDLPCMDNDDLRRGHPTLHKLFGEAEAILAGDYLLTYAFEVLSKAPHLTAEKKINLIQTLANRSGGEGMIGGQMVDLLSEGKMITEQTLFDMFKKKTATLLATALEFGSIIADLSSEDRIHLETAGYALGMGYQCMDDLLDVTSTESVLGKPIGSDIANQKATCLTLYSPEEVKDLATAYFKEAKASLSRLSEEVPTLEALFDACSKRLN